MNSFIEIVSQYRLHVLIVFFIIASSCVAHFYHTSVRSPKSHLTITGSCILEDDVKVYFVTLKKGVHRDLHYLIQLVGRYGFVFANSLEMNRLRVTNKLPIGITVISIHGPSALVIHVTGRAPHMMETTEQHCISVHDRYTRFAVVTSCRVAVGVVDKTSASPVAA